MRRSISCGLALLALLAVGCKSNPRQDPILRLSAVEALEQGKQMMEEKKYFKARRLLTHAFEVEPNSRSGREALLLAADAYFLHGGPDNYIKCEAKYRDFLNRFPTSERSDYAQFQVANCLAQRMEKPDRDQKVTSKALEAFEELIRLYPTSEYVDDARLKIVEVRNNLAASELVVGSFYLRYGLCYATVKRLEFMLETYPDFDRMDETLFTLGLAYRRCRQDKDADDTFERLQEEHPQSEYTARFPKEDEAARKKVDKQMEKQKRKLAARKKS